MFQSGDHGRSEWPRADRHLGANGAGPQAPEPLMTPSDEAAFTHGPAHGPMIGRGGERFFFRSTSHPHLSTDPFLVYDGWNVVEVLNAQNATTQRYTWGLDLSGQSGDSGISGIHGAGGIGGLLAVVETAGTHQGSYWYLYDANGNVGQVLDASDPQNIATAARYEYDPYGNSLAATGPYAAANPFRFSTKWLEANWLYYFGYRYYSPGLGRWINRDPIAEAGGLNIYSHTHNSAMNKVDPLGQFAWWDCVACIGAIGTKYAAGVIGCRQGCKANPSEHITYEDCVAECEDQYFSVCELWNQFKDNKAEWLAAGTCVSCGVRAMIKLKQYIDSKTSPPECSSDDCIKKYYGIHCHLKAELPSSDHALKGQQTKTCFYDCDDGTAVQLKYAANAKCPPNLVKSPPRPK